MGSGSSKDATAAGGGRKARSRRIRVFNSSCFGLSSTIWDERVSCFYLRFSFFLGFCSHSDLVLKCWLFLSLAY